MRRPRTICLSRMVSQAVQVFGILFLGACASHPIAREGLSVEADPIKETERLELELKQARTQQLPLLAPDAYARAEKSLAEAKVDQAAFSGPKKPENLGDKRDAWLDSLAEGFGALNAGKRSAEQASTELENVLKARLEARKAGAAEFAVGYPDAEQRLVELSRALEHGDKPYVEKHKAEVAEAFHAMEISSVTNRFLGGANLVVKEAISEGARKYVPETLEETTGKLKAAEDFILKNPENVDGITDLADEAYFNANRLLQLTREARAFALKTPEQEVLWVEQKLASLADAVDSDDNRDKGFDEQVAGIEEKLSEVADEREDLSKRAQKLSADLEDMREQLGVAKEETENEQAKLARLQKEKETDEKLDRVRSLFTPDEASVTREGQRIWVRLRGLRFPPGRASLSPEAYPLLGKVQKAIQVFGTPHVIIEGRTDTTGAVALNQRLSLARARSVRQYLLSKRTLPDDKIDAQGVSVQDPALRSDRSRIRESMFLLIPSGSSRSEKDLRSKSGAR